MTAGVELAAGVGVEACAAAVVPTVGGGSVGFAALQPPSSKATAAKQAATLAKLRRGVGKRRLRPMADMRAWHSPAINRVLPDR